VEPSLILVGGVVAAVFVLTSVIITTFLRSVDAGEILLASRGRNLQIFRGPCKALILPIITQTRVIPAQAINVDIEITDQTADVDANGRSAPIKGEILTRGLGLDAEFKTRFVDGEPHEHIFRAKPPDVSRARGAENVEKVDGPVTSPRTFTLCHAGHLLNGRLWGQGGALG